MRDLNSLSLFAAVVSNGGISAAARAVGAPKSRVSRQVAVLEEALGVRLLERSTRSVRVTTVGNEVYRHARAALAEADAIDDTISRLKSEPQGLVRIIIPVGLDAIVGEALPEFLRNNQKLRLQIVVTNRRVDLIDEGIDIAIRVHESPEVDGALQRKVLAPTGALLVASPRFVAEYGEPARPGDLDSCPTISLAERVETERWTLADKNGCLVDIVHEPKISASTFSGVRGAVLAGGGIAKLPEYICREFIQTGQLVRILPEWTIPQDNLHLVFASRRSLLPSIRTVIDFLAATLKPGSAAWTTAIGSAQ